MKPESPLKIQIVTPPLPHSQSGNELTAFRYARLVRRLGHRVAVDTSWDGQSCDVMIALHARRSHVSIADFAERYPGRPLIVVLTGTDLYRDIHTDVQAKLSLQLASQLVVLQAMGVQELPEAMRAKTRVIYQSAPPLRAPAVRPMQTFRVTVVGHLRPEKDPFRTAQAARRLPARSRVQVLQVGAALGDDMAAQARDEAATNPRYRWVGLKRHWQARRLLAGSHLTSISSLMEGSSNVLCEALASCVPVVASRISGLMGTLGEDFPAYFAVGDTAALAQLLERLEFDEAFYERVRQHCISKADLVRPERELEAWAGMLTEIAD